MASKTPAKANANSEAGVLARIASMRAPYGAMGKRIHDIILENAPALKARVWYGMPGYGKGGGPVLCFFRVDERYMTFGLTEKAAHKREVDADDYLMASAWFFETLDEATEARLADIVRQAVS